MVNTAIVVGGTRRIGRWVSEALCVQGFEVHALYRADGASADQFATELGLAGYRLLVSQVDAEEPEALAEAVKGIASGADGVKVLVNCVGSATEGGLLATSPARLTAVWSSNVLTVHNAVTAAVPYLRLEGGRIINFLSISTDTLRAFRQLPGYAACKAMLASYSRSLARELAADGITVNCIALGATEQPAENVSAVVEDNLPTGRMVSQADLAAVLWYLAGPHSSQVTGTVVNLSGGWAL